MSASTHTSTARRQDNQDAVAAQANGQDTASNTVTIEIAGQDVTLPLKFTPGHVLTENQAKILDAAYQRQFTNNQNAMAKARAEKLAKATTHAEREAAAPLSATKLAELYADYEPNVGGTRMGSMEKIRNDAAWRMWTALVADHNANVEANRGSPDYMPVIVKAGKSLVPSLKPVRGTDGKVVAGGTVAEQRDRMVARLLTMPEYADRIQLHVDAIMAERGASKETGTAEDTVSIDSLFD